MRVATEHEKGDLLLVPDELFHSTGDTRPPDITIYNLDNGTNKSLEHKLGFAHESVLHNKVSKGNGVWI